MQHQTPRYKDERYPCGGNVKYLGDWMRENRVWAWVKANGGFSAVHVAAVR